MLILKINCNISGVMSWIGTHMKVKNLMFECHRSPVGAVTFLFVFSVPTTASVRIVTLRDSIRRGDITSNANKKSYFDVYWTVHHLDN